VTQLRAERQANRVTPITWLPERSFDPSLGGAIGEPVTDNEDLAFMHRNWDLSVALRPPAGRGLRSLLRRLLHPFVMVVLSPYLAQLQDYVAHNTRAMDRVARRADALSEGLEAVRSDMIDFAHHVDERVGG
jgi:hypothetical protein